MSKSFLKETKKQKIERLNKNIEKLEWSIEAINTKYIHAGREVEIANIQKRFRDILKIKQDELAKVIAAK